MNLYKSCYTGKYMLEKTSEENYNKYINWVKVKFLSLFSKWSTDR